MQIVIEIPEEIYKEWKNTGKYYSFSYAQKLILNGTPLPKDHGRLIDADKLISSFPNYDGISDVIKTINYTDTIIEADKGERE